MNKYFLITLLATCILFACKTEPKNKKIKTEERLERWSVTGDSSAYEKGVIQYLETKLFNEKEEVKAIAYYNKDKQLTAKESRVFDSETNMTKGAQFRDTNDSLLSYYTYDLNDKGLIELTKAFDASNDELLRQEKFTYDSRGHMIAKSILDSNGLPVRKFEFTVDKKGNEMEVRVLNPDNTPILVETFKITKTDGQGNWIEKWGFVNDQPFSYLAREIKYN